MFKIYVEAVLLMDHIYVIILYLIINPQFRKITERLANIFAQLPIRLLTVYENR